ncbi:NAD-dependent epimerase/dehydratase family protein [Nesterenkonia ebinurensis]|uniref:NAD-dependent epimerase/dehydratase family protein n=1 Tax=Nesterenkonia ebinurensis TaxID=2608252 RepID=UPI00123CC7F8|nr:NAD-dependent epimerase/dehydratase family protein [Nesterenkonia ebinurensis]
MKILVLGGTAWLSRLIAETARDAGHEITCAARGLSGDSAQGVPFIQWDRSQKVPPEITSAYWDVVVDVSGNPGQVQRAVEAIGEAHWIFISTISVYADHSRPQGRPTTTPLLQADDREGPPESGEMYGAMKIACEEILEQNATHSTVLRPGLIVGPGDPTGRFTYWPLRIHEAAQGDQSFIAPSPETTPLQWIDVRDLAEWTVQLAESSTPGIFDAVGPPIAREAFISQLAMLHSPAPSPLWVSAEKLVGLDVRPWMGPRSIPLWAPWQGWEHLMNRDHRPAAQTGLRTRSLKETALQTRSWAENITDAATGLRRAEELDLLKALAI